MGKSSLTELATVNCFPAQPRGEGGLQLSTDQNMLSHMTGPDFISVSPAHALCLSITDISKLSVLISMT